MVLSFENKNEEKDEITARVHTKFSSTLSLDRMELTYKDPVSGHDQTVVMNKDENVTSDYIAALDISKWDTMNVPISVNMYIADGDDYQKIITGTIEENLSE